MYSTWKFGAAENAHLVKFHVLPSGLRSGLLPLRAKGGDALSSGEIELDRSAPLPPTHV